MYLIEGQGKVVIKNDGEQSAIRWRPLLLYYSPLQQFLLLSYTEEQDVKKVFAILLLVDKKYFPLLHVVFVSWTYVLKERYGKNYDGSSVKGTWQ
jgi:hypothetical protein